MARDDWKARDATVDAVRRQQHTGNHPDQGGPARKGEGADAHGGTRAGAENVERPDLQRPDLRRTGQPARP